MDISQMLYSAGLSIGAYAIYKAFINFYNKYYLKSECHQRTLEITVVDVNENKEKDESKEEKQEIELENKKNIV